MIEISISHMRYIFKGNLLREGSTGQYELIFSGTEKMEKISRDGSRIVKNQLLSDEKRKAM